MSWITASIAAYAKAFLGGQKVSFDLDRSTAMNCRSIEFLKEIESSNGMSEILTSLSVNGWLSWLKQKNATSVILYYRPGDQNNISDRYSGKDHWGIEANQKDFSDRWEGNPKFVGKPLETRVWKVTYEMISQSVPPLPVAVRPVAEMRQELSVALAKIYQFARENKEKYFADLFTKSLDVLEASNPSGQSMYKDLLPPGYSLGARQILAACETAFVFGGMGSWNDGIDYPFADDRERYHKVSENLFQTINQSIISAINSY